MKAPSIAAKAYMSAAAAMCALIAGTFIDTTLGRICAVIGAGITAYLATWKTRNTETVETGPGDGPVQVGTVLSDTGVKVGEVLADTGAATGGVVAGTTGLVGQVLNATVGKVLPTGGGGRHGGA